MDTDGHDGSTERELEREREPLVSVHCENDALAREEAGFERNF